MIELVRNPDVLAELVRQRSAGAGPADQVLVGFAAETGDDTNDVLTLGRQKLARKGADLMIVNEVGPAVTFGPGREQRHDRGSRRHRASRPARPQVSARGGGLGRGGGSAPDGRAARLRPRSGTDGPWPIDVPSHRPAVQSRRTRSLQRVPAPFHLRVRDRRPSGQDRDQISDAVLDAMLKVDPKARVAVETLVTTGLVHVAGEVTTDGYVEIPSIVRERSRDRLRHLGQGFRR